MSDKKVFAKPIGNWIKITEEPFKENCIVFLEEIVDGSQMHVATYHPNLIAIGGHFEFDMPKVLYWMPLPKPPFINTAQAEPTKTQKRKEK